MSENNKVTIPELVKFKQDIVYYIDAYIEYLTLHNSSRCNDTVVPTQLRFLDQTVQHFDRLLYIYGGSNNSGGCMDGTTSDTDLVDEESEDDTDLATYLSENQIERSNQLQDKILGISEGENHPINSGHNNSPVKDDDDIDDNGNKIIDEYNKLFEKNTSSNDFIASDSSIDPVMYWLESDDHTNDDSHQSPTHIPTHTSTSCERLPTVPEHRAPKSDFISATPILPNQSLQSNTRHGYQEIINMVEANLQKSKRDQEIINNEELPKIKYIDTDNANPLIRSQKKSIKPFVSDIIIDDAENYGDL